MEGMAQESEERTIEISIEALTGTVYDLCVSPYETILGIKLKVQRLEGIPVYQQQLVWGDIELQDEFCLEEYSIPSGAQLKLMVAMRGGPIHAQRVHVDLEDQAFLEITELLDMQGGDKYALMLLRSGDDLEHASIVQVQMLEDPSVDAIRLSPIHLSESGQQLGMTASKATQSEHAMTKDKMKLLMAKLKKGKGFRQQPSYSQMSSGQISRKATGKVLILESRTPSRVLTASRGSAMASTHPSEARRVERKLVFCGEEQSPSSALLCNGKTRQRVTSCSRSRTYDPNQDAPIINRTYDPDQDTPIISRKSCSRVGRNRSSRPPSLLKMDVSQEGVSSRCGKEGVASHSTAPTTTTSTAPTTTTSTDAGTSSCGDGSASRQKKGWQRSSKRKRRMSHMETNPPSTLATLSRDLSRLDLTPPLPPPPPPPPPPPFHSTMLTLDPKCAVQQNTLHKYRTLRTTQDSHTTPYRGTTSTSSNTSSHHLPPIVHPYQTTHTSLTSATLSRSRGFSERLPSLAIAASGRQDLTVGRKKRCMKCGKRVGLASTYSCRCGGLFCALHRYAETHACSFDYKSEGRQLLARTNPVIAAQKLPKI